MSCQCKNSSLSVALVLIVVFGLFVTGALSTVFAAPPSKSDCTQADVYERLECKQNALVGQLNHMVDVNLKSGAISDALSERQKKVLDKEKSKANVIKDHIKKDNFKSVVKGIRKNNKKSCELVPLEGHEVEGHINGICEPDRGETCAAEEDLTQPCDPKLKRPHPRKPGLVCAQICETEAAQTDEEEEVELQEVAQELENSYDALEDNLIETNEVLEEVNSILDNEAVELRMASDDPCANITELPEGLEESLYILRVAAATTMSVHHITAAGTRQTVVAVAVAAGFGGGGGGNSSAAGIVTATLAGVTNIAYLAVEEIVGLKQSELDKNTFACLQKAVHNIASVEGKVDANAKMLQDEIIAAKTALSEQIELLRAELVELLNTAQGLRPGFPEK